ncbi:putative membrane protein [Halobacteriovorax marinus SJ]|uniref:Membrane protein n=1 Tax=Halobacteriovorax marinus (strain ATCC BAA-682 / DSM 15412 / SJ) TaxID=862908 RepID=E1X557_HALMS|nr:hemolysin III family protein [Halobacteriovorax marinus]CBW25528.1 putative membrane protein [Halobacteriovorax marinus SJ]
MNSRNISGYTDNEEIANTLTHFLGIVLSIYVILSFLSLGASYLVYGLSLLALYCSSTFYHLTRIESRKLLFKKFDHICIYYLIAGSYTPIMMNKVGGQLGVTVTILVWIIAFFGTIYKLKSRKSNKIISTLSYLIMGWLVVFFWADVFKALSHESLKWLATGGILYSVGVIFYSLKKIPYTHAIWHLFVLAGSFAHYICIKSA